MDHKLSMILDGQVVQPCFWALLIALLSQALVRLFVFEVELVNLGQLFYQSPGLVLPFDMELRFMSSSLVSSWSTEHLGLLPHALDICTELV